MSAAESAWGRSRASSAALSGDAASSTARVLPASTVENAPLVTGVLLKVYGRKGEQWWESLGLPAPWKWGDDTAYVYVARAAQVPA